jgi:hypothetical protein
MAHARGCRASADDSCFDDRNAQPFARTLAAHADPTMPAPMMTTS